LLVRVTSVRVSGKAAVFVLVGAVFSTFSVSVVLTPCCDVCVACGDAFTLCFFVLDTSASVPIAASVTGLGISPAADTQTATTETLAEETPTEMVAEEFDDVEIISDYNETPVTYKGESGILRKDGQTWTVETPTTIYDLDGVDDNTSLSTAGVQIADKININEDGSFSIRDKEYANMFSDPLTAITINEDGTYTVRLDTKGDNPQPRNFRGQLAEDLAYQITLAINNYRGD